MRDMAFILLLGLSLAILIGGCVRQSTSSSFEWLEESSNFVEVYPEEVRGNISIAGSSTVFPLAEAIANGFISEGYLGSVTIDSIGSGGGFERFCTSGESDISNASRPIKNEERENCRRIGREPIEFLIATDALSVVVNLDNNWARDLTIKDLAQVFTAERWSDVDSSWPDEEIQRFIPGTDSGTFDYFVEAVFDKDAEPLLSAANIQFSEDDNVLVQGIQGNKYAVGFFGYAYYTNNASLLKIVDIEGVPATDQEVNSGNYPLSRPLFMYSDAEIMSSRPQVSAFLAYVLLNATREAGSVGYFPATPESLSYSKELWLEALQEVLPY